MRGTGLAHLFLDQTLGGKGLDDRLVAFAPDLRKPGLAAFFIDAMLM